jgi:putative addiction module component (TIGR02574 family)
MGHREGGKSTARRTVGKREHRGLDRSVLAAHDPSVATDRVRKLLALAAELPTEERAELVHELARTLPETYDADDLDLDYEELDRRMESVREGMATLVPWEQARKELLSNG